MASQKAFYCMCCRHCLHMPGSEVVSLQSARIYFFFFFIIISISFSIITAERLGPIRLPRVP